MGQLPMRDFVWLKGKVFKIPSQQRGYKWTPSNIEELLRDLWEFINAPEEKRIYCLQPLAVVSLGSDKYSILDGQQRLTTLFLLYKYLTKQDAYQLDFDRDLNGTNRWGFLTDIFRQTLERAQNQIDLFYIYQAYQTISDCFENRATEVFPTDGKTPDNDTKRRFIELLEGKGKKSIRVIWYEVPENKAHETFRNLNDGKITLTNTELIKALFLNRVSGLCDGMREYAARQFEEMEQAFNNDHFWAMLSSQEPAFPHTRMDLMFNLIAKIDETDTDNDFRSSFRWFADKANGNLEEKWGNVRDTFIRLLDLYKNIYTYHYIGYLTYCTPERDRYKFLVSILKSNQEYSKTGFVNRLRTEIRLTVNRNDKLSVSDFEYGQMSTVMLRRFFLLHNIETLLQKYEILSDSKTLNLQHEYEQFPFELLHKQNWDIEHISSQTDSKFDSEQDRKDWLSSVKNDYPHYFEVDEIKDKESQYNQKQSKENFQKLYDAVVRYNDAQDRDNIQEGEKNQVGNLVLLDSHTNRSFHNSLFPRKRRIVIIANGLISDNDEETDVKQVYIPPCTMQCFIKSYSKKSSTKLNSWFQSDADAYTDDIKQKLCDKPGCKKYFRN